MASGSFVQVTSGVGPKLSTGPTYTDESGSNIVQDQKVIMGEPYMATYTVSIAGLSVGTANSHLVQIMAGSSNIVRIRRIRLTQNAASGSINILPLQILRLTSAGTGGTVVAPRPMDTVDAGSGATAMTLPSSKGTEGVQLWQESRWLMTNALAPAPPFEWTRASEGKPIVIPAGTANGIALKNTLGPATATVDITVEFVETVF